MDGSDPMTDGWRQGSKLAHPFNPELGVGVVLRVRDRFIEVVFPGSGEQRTFSVDGSGLRRLVLPAGARVTLAESGEAAVIAEAHGHAYLLADGRVVADAEVWPEERPDTLADRLAALDLDRVHTLRHRLDGMRLDLLRRSSGLGSFLGGRIELYGHQLFTAERACSADPVRWLLADDVGLGKTVVACLILSSLVRSNRANTALVVAPSQLTVQWLGELYRKFHQVFVHLDEERIEHVARDFGGDVNPFDVHGLAVVSSELLARDGALLDAAREAAPDLVVIDEAHRVARAAPRVLDLAGSAHHALLLTATPLQADHEGFFRLYRCLHPEAFGDRPGFEAALASGDAVLSCTSAVTRDDIGGLPPRVPAPVVVGSPTEAVADDPRVAWLCERAPEWLAASEKVLVFTRDRPTLDALRRQLETRARTHVHVFHEAMSSAALDIQVARFRASGSPLLLSTEAGGEGRNFQFCDRMVHFDLPIDPMRLEQRIGRLDRIGRKEPVEIVYFRHMDGPPGSDDLCRLYERLGIFERPVASLDPSLARIAERLAADASPDVDALAEEALDARRQAKENLTKVLYRDGYSADREEEVLERVPPTLDEDMRRFCVRAAELLGLDVVGKGGAARTYMEMGTHARVDALPGLPDDPRFLGTFDRAEALEHEQLDFFSNGHPLVEALFAEHEDGRRGRVCAVEIPVSLPVHAGLAALVAADDGPELLVVDMAGEPQDDTAEPLLVALGTARDWRPDKEINAGTWGTLIRRLGALVDGTGRAEALVFFRTSER